MRTAVSVETRYAQRFNMVFVFQHKFSTFGLKCMKCSLVSFYCFLSLPYLFFTSVLRFSPRFSSSLLNFIFVILLLVIPSINWISFLRLLSILLSLVFYQFLLSLLNFSLVFFFFFLVDLSSFPKRHFRYIFLSLFIFFLDLSSFSLNVIFLTYFCLCSPSSSISLPFPKRNFPYIFLSQFTFFLDLSSFSLNVIFLT